MDHSRRDFGFFLPLLALQDTALPSKIYRFEDLPVRTKGENRSRAIFDGKTARGTAIEIHATELAPGLAPHASHRHVHEELVIIREGTLEVTINGKKEKAGPGSVVYVASNEEHGLQNAGPGRAHYYIMTIGREKA